MKRIAALTIALYSFTASAQLAASTNPPSPIGARLDSLFQKQPLDKPGFALSIEYEGRLLYRNAKGLADKNRSLDTASDFRMASISKQFTAFGIIGLQKSNQLSFDDTIGRWLPSLPANIRSKVRIRHLLTHSSGILDYESLIPAGQTTQVLDEDVLRLLSKKDSLYFTPGTKFRYSNSGYCLLALIGEKIAELSFAQGMQLIFASFNMDSTTIYRTGHHIPHRAMGFPADQSVTSATKGDGGVYTSLLDYEKWIHRLMYDTSLAYLPALSEIRRPIEGRPKTYYAAGWFIVDGPTPIYFHSGSTCGFANFVIAIPRKKMIVTYFSNLAENTAPFHTIIDILRQQGLPDLRTVFPLHNLTN